jgi:hypothetical protein
MARGGLWRGIKRGNQGGGVKTLTWHLYANAGWRGVDGCGRERWWCGRAWRRG